MAENLEIFENLLLLAVENGASDIHIKTDRPAYLRLQGALEPVDMDKLTNPQINDFIEKTCPGQFFERWRADNQVDYSYRLEDVGRFRVSAFYQRGTPSIVFRHVKDQPPTFEQLNHEPAVLNKLCRQKDGIALICGATGSGKSSTLPAMLNWINHNYEKHIVTLEDPIEFTTRTSRP